MWRGFSMVEILISRRLSKDAETKTPYISAMTISDISSSAHKWQQRANFHIQIYLRIAS
jgi:hypothetical protein